MLQPHMSYKDFQLGSKSSPALCPAHFESKFANVHPAIAVSYGFIQLCTVRKGYACRVVNVRLVLEGKKAARRKFLVKVISLHRAPEAVV